MMKYPGAILLLQNVGGFYGCTVVVLEDLEVEGIKAKLESIQQAPGFIKVGDNDGVSWRISILYGPAVAVFKTGGQDAEAKVLKLLGKG